MIPVEKTVLILLAAGRSERFGDLDKLEQEFPRPARSPCMSSRRSRISPSRARFVIKNGTDLDFARHGYKVIHNDDPAVGMSRSVKLGVQSARDDGAEAVLIALADMPRVTASHVYHLLEAVDLEPFGGRIERRRAPLSARRVRRRAVRLPAHAGRRRRRSRPGTRGQACGGVPGGTDRHRHAGGSGAIARVGPARPLPKVRAFTGSHSCRSASIGFNDAARLAGK